MKRSNRLLILIGVFLAIIAMVFTIVFASKGISPSEAAASATPSPTPMTTIVYAKTTIGMGQTIDATMIDTKPITVAEKLALTGTPFTKSEEVIGLKSGAQILEGAYIYADRDISVPGSIKLGQDIAPSIATGKRGVAMEVDQVNGVGTLIVPGDRVDVILSVWYDQLGIDGVKVGQNATLKIASGQHVTTKVVIQNVKVIATLLPAPEPTTGGAAATGSAAPSPSVQTVTLTTQHMIVVLEVAPEEAEVIRWGQREEKVDPQNYIALSLALRSDTDNEKVTTQGITFAQLVKFYGVMPIDPRGIIPADLLAKITW